MTLFMLFFIFIFKLQDTCFVVFGIVKHVVDDEEWWYTAYTCNKSVYPDSDMFFFFCVWKMQQTCNKCCFKVIFVPLIFQFYFVFLFDPLCLLKTFLGIVSRFVFLMNQIQPLLWFLIRMLLSFSASHVLICLKHTRRSLKFIVTFVILIRGT